MPFLQQALRQVSTAVNASVGRAVSFDPQPQVTLGSITGCPPFVRR